MVRVTLSVCHVEPEVKTGRRLCFQLDAVGRFRRKNDVQRKPTLGPGVLVFRYKMQSGCRYYIL